MARKPRVHYPGAVYHVIARGNNQENIFQHANDKLQYLQLLAKYHQKYAIDVLAYVLMDNHLHLLLQVSVNPLSKFMQGIQQSYTHYFNRKYIHVGHVFQQRYKSFLCTDDTYLFTLLCYIHQNPVRAKISEGLNYKWSSHTAYCRGSDSLVNVSYILNCFDLSTHLAVKQYKDMVMDVEPVRMLDINVSTTQTGQLVFQPTHLEEANLLVPTSDWGELVNNIAVKWGIEESQLLGPCRIRNVVAARNRLIYEAVNQKVCSRAEIALRLHIDPARVTRGYQSVFEEKQKGKY